MEVIAAAAALSSPWRTPISRPLDGSHSFRNATICCMCGGVIT